MHPISDATIGSRFWLETDFSAAARPIAEGNMRPVDVRTANIHNSAVFTFLDAAGDSMAKSAIDKAELFAATHVLNGQDRNAERARADRNIERLIGGEDRKRAFLDQATELFRAKHPDVGEADARDICARALTKLMATREFTERARLSREDLARDGEVPLDVCLDAEGVASAKNAVAGLAHMLHKGQISEDAVLVLADSDFYDASNRSDLLRLAAESAKKVKEIFIGEKRMQKLIDDCSELLNAVEGRPNADEVTVKIQQLAALKNASVAARKAATACLKTDYLLTDPSGGTKKDKKFQKEQLDAIRNSLRAFRYDLDSRVGGGMGGVTAWLRRKADNLFSAKVENRMTAAQLDAIEEADEAFNALLTEIRQDLGVDVDNAPAEAEGKYRNATENGVTEGSLMSLRDSARAATHLSHLTNDRIRYHYSGVEKQETKTANAIRAELGDIAENSGKRYVTFRVTADFVAKLGVNFAKAALKAGGSVDLKTEIKVSQPGGPVEATFSWGGKGHVGAEAKFGVDPKDENATDAQRTGFGAKAEADASLGIHFKTTKVYPNLDEFIKTIGTCHPIVNPKAMGLMFSAVKKAARAVGHVFVAGATLTGLRIHRSRMDQLEYGRSLRDRNVFGPLAGVFLKKRNVEIAGIRKAKEFGAGVKISGEAGLYVTEDKETGSDLNGGVTLGYDYSREFSVKGMMYESFARSLSNCSAAYLQGRLADEFAVQSQTLQREAAWCAEIANLCALPAPAGNDEAADAAARAEAIKSALAIIPRKLEALEESAIGADSGNRDFWAAFAAKARILTVAVALLAKRAEELGDGVAGAAAARQAARAAASFVLPRLANPVVEVPEKLYREKFFTGFSIAKPPVSTHTGYVNLSFEFLDRTMKSPLGKLDDMVKPGDSDGSLVKGGKDLAKVGIDKFGGAAMDTARDVVPIPKKIQVKVTRTNIVGKTEDPRPWLKHTHKTSISLRIDSGLTLGILVKAIAKAYVKSSEDLTDEDVAEVKIGKEIWSAIKDTAKTTVEDAAVDSIIPLMDMSLGKLAGKYSFFDKLLKGAHAFDEELKADYDAKNEAFKTVTWDFGSDGRFSGFSVTDDTDYSGMFKFQPTAFLEFSVGMESHTEVGEYSILFRPTPNILMERAADYIASGNPEGFRNLLARTKIGVQRLVQAGAPQPAARPDDDRWQADCDSMVRLLADLNEKIVGLTYAGAKTAEDAAEFRRQYDDVSRRVLLQDQNLDRAEAVNIAYDLFTLAARVYTLYAMTARAVGR